MSHAKSIGTHDDSDILSVPRECHLFAVQHTVNQVWQRCPSIADSDSVRHGEIVQSCTSTVQIDLTDQLHRFSGRVVVGHSTNGGHSLRQLTKRYGKVDALHELTLDVEAGEVLGFLGPNGAGKTTTIRLLLGLIRPTSGHAELFGMDAQRDAIAIHKRLAYVPGDTALWPSLTGEETLHFFSEVHGSVDEAYRTELIEMFDFDPTKKARAYSKGQSAEDRVDRRVRERAPNCSCSTSRPAASTR